MVTMSNESTSTADREIVISRLINAPRELVYEAWTDPRHMVHWYGPNGFTSTITECDVRVGGVMRMMMHGPDGTDYPNKMTYLEVVPPERIVCEYGAGDEPDPGDFLQTVTFEDAGGKTQVTMRGLFASAAARDMVVEKYGAIEGGNQTLARLDEYVSKL